MNAPGEPPLDREQIADELRKAHLLKMRGSSVEAMAHLRSLTESRPDEPAFWETYGDELIEAELLEQARDAYFQAKELRKPRLSAEKKYADVVYRISTGGMPMSQADVLGSPALLALASALLPGAGQFLNGQLAKAAALFGAWLVCFLPLIVIWRDAVGGPVSGSRQALNNLMAAVAGAPGILILLGLVAIVIFAASDAYSTARRALEASFPSGFIGKEKPAMPDARFFDDVKRELEARKAANDDNDCPDASR